MTFTVTTAVPNNLGLAEICQRHVDELWVPVHLDAEQAAAFVLDHFRRAVLGNWSCSESKVPRQGTTSSRYCENLSREVMPTEFHQGKSIQHYPSQKARQRLLNGANFPGGRILTQCSAGMAR
jgi:hypothetical protein